MKRSIVTATGLSVLCSCSSLFHDTTEFLNGPDLVERDTILTMAFGSRGARATDPASWKLLAEAHQGRYEAVLQFGFDDTADCYARRTDEGQWEAVLVLMDRDVGATLEDDRRGKCTSERFWFFWHR